LYNGKTTNLLKQFDGSTAIQSFNRAGKLLEQGD